MTMANPVKRLFDWKVRGIRWIEIIGVMLVAAMVFSVYVAKAAAARESARIGELERDITENRQRVRLLRAEASRLEQPMRLEALSRAAGLGPVEVDRRTTEPELATLEPAPEPQPQPRPQPQPQPPAPVVPELVPTPAAPAAEAAQ